MTRCEKVELVEKLSSSFAGSNIVVCDYKGLTVKELEALRKSALESNSRVQVIKNKLASIALKNASIDGILLKDTNIFVWGEDQIALSKSVQKFSDENKGKFVVKTGYFDGKVVDAKHIESISKLPNKEELLGMLLSVWTAPARYFVTGLDNLRKSKDS